MPAVTLIVLLAIVAMEAVMGAVRESPELQAVSAARTTLSVASEGEGLWAVATTMGGHPKIAEKCSEARSSGGLTALQSLQQRIRAVDRAKASDLRGAKADPDRTATANGRPRPAAFSAARPIGTI